MRKRFHYIDENNKNQLDLIRLFEYAFNGLSTDDIIKGIAKLSKHINLKKIS